MGARDLGSGLLIRHTKIVIVFKATYVLLLKQAATDLILKSLDFVEELGIVLLGFAGLGAHSVIQILC